MQMRVRNGLAGLYETDDDVTDVLTDFVELFHFETAGEQLVFQFLRCAVDIYIFF